MDGEPPNQTAAFASRTLVDSLRLQPGEPFHVETENHLYLVTGSLTHGPTALNEGALLRITSANLHATTHALLIWVHHLNSKKNG